MACAEALSWHSFGFVERPKGAAKISGFSVHHQHLEPTVSRIHVRCVATSVYLFGSLVKIITCFRLMSN